MQQRKDEVEAGLRLEEVVHGVNDWMIKLELHLIFNETNMNGLISCEPIFANHFYSVILIFLTFNTL